MAKVISVADDVHKTLYQFKGKDSYSVTIRNLLQQTSNKESLLSFFGKDGINHKAIESLKNDWKRWSKKVYHALIKQLTESLEDAKAGRILRIM